jgi:hypothetical protein
MRKMGLELENEIEPLSSERAPVYLGALCIAIERKERCIWKDLPLIVL